MREDYSRLLAIREDSGMLLVIRRDSGRLLVIRAGLRQKLIFPLSKLTFFRRASKSLTLADKKTTFVEQVHLLWNKCIFCGQSKTIVDKVKL